MEWIYQEPSAPWQWIGIILGILGFGLASMAIPTVLQMFFGRPQISIEFKEADFPETRALQCHIENEPIRSRVLRSLGVFRQSTHITVSISLYEQGTEKIIFKHAPLEINCGQGNGIQIGELTSAWPVITAPFVQRRDSTFAYLNSKKQIDIPPGYYFVKLMVVAENKQCIIKERKIHMGNHATELYWLS